MSTSINNWHSNYDSTSSSNLISNSYSKSNSNSTLIVIWLLIVFWQLTVTQYQISHSNANNNWTPTSILATNSDSRSN